MSKQEATEVELCLLKALCPFKKHTLLQKGRHSALGEERRIPGTIPGGNQTQLVRTIPQTRKVFCTLCGLDVLRDVTTTPSCVQNWLLHIRKGTRESLNSSELLNVNKMFWFPPDVLFFNPLPSHFIYLCPMWQLCLMIILPAFEKLVPDSLPRGINNYTEH